MLISKFDEIIKAEEPDDMPIEYRSKEKITSKAAKIRFIERVDFSYFFERQVREFGNMRESELDELVKSRVVDELYFEIINKEFANKMGFLFSEKDYENHLRWVTSMHGIDLEFYRTRYTYESYLYEMRYNCFTSFFEAYSKNNLIELRGV